MRRYAVLILLLAVGCASSASNPGRITVDLIEARQPGQRFPTIGNHQYRVRVHNRSEQVITIESIHLDLVGTSDLELEGGYQLFGRTVDPLGTEDFDMWVTVGAPPGRVSRSMYEYNIDSLRVTVYCRTDSGTFVDSDTYPIVSR